MPKLLSMLIAAGFGVGLHGAIAQDVTSEGQRAQGQEKLMQQKEQGAGQSQNGARERPSPSYERTESPQHNDSTQNSQHTDSGSGQSDQNAAQPGQVPQQSMPSVGHPQEGGQTGQFGTKDMDQSGQSDSASKSKQR